MAVKEGRGSEMDAQHICIKRLDACTFQQAVDLWNDGFSGYYSQMSMDLTKYLNKLTEQSIRPDLSVAAFVDDQPAGFILVGVKTVNGRKFGWNGGTGVSPAFRRRGIAKLLMMKAAEILKEEGIDVAMLEVVQKNAGAVAVYESAGFRIKAELIGMKRAGALPADTFHAGESAGKYKMEHASPGRIGGLPFYRKEAAWTSQWFNMRDNDGLLIIDEQGQIAGYALARRKLDAWGKTVSIRLFQCETDPVRADKEPLTKALLAAVFSPMEEDCERIADNLALADPTAVRLLQDAGFETEYTQYLMMKIDS